MNETMKRALYLNALRVAQADGRFDPREKKVLGALAQQLGISEDQGWRWFAELELLPAEELPAVDHPAALRLVAVVAELALADGDLDESEARLLAQIYEGLRLAPEELRGAVPSELHARLGWATAPVPAGVAPSSSGAVPGDPPVARGGDPGVVLLLTDHFEHVDAFEAASPGLAFQRRSLAELRATPASHAVAVFHGGPDKPSSLAALKLLRANVSGARVIGVMHRTQAYLIGYLLEAGLDRCIVEPASVGELTKVIVELSQRGASVRATTR